MFAGTEWGTVQSGWPLHPSIVKICVPFFDLQQKFEIAAHIHPHGCVSEAFVESLHCIGDTARCAVEFCQQSLLSKSELRADALIELASDIEQSHCRQWNEKLTSSDLINLVAYSMSGLPVSPCDRPRVPIIASSPQQLTWQQLADLGLLILISCQGKLFVRIPFTVIRACACQTIGPDAGPIKVAFLKALKVLVELPSVILES